MTINQIISVLVENSLNHAISQHSVAQTMLQQQPGKIVRVLISDLALQFNFIIEGHKLVILSDYDGQVDASISARGLNLLALMTATHPDLANQPNLSISGDVRLLQYLTELLQLLITDWEEYVARLIGDIPAHQLANFTQTGYAYTKARKVNFELNLAAYLQEEQHYLPSSIEVEYLLNAVDQLRDDTERLALRLQKLQKLQK